MRPQAGRAASLRVRLGALVAASLLCACGPDLPTPPDPDGDPSAAWARRLREVVSPVGEVDYTDLRADPRALRDFVGWSAAHGPETEQWRNTDDNRRLAFLLNALNANTLWAVVEGVERPPPGGGRPFARLRFRVDGEVVRYDRFVTHRVLAPIEEPLAVAGLACASRSCPPVPDTLFEKKDLDEALTRRMRRWLTSGRLVRLAPGEAGALAFSPALRPWLDAFARFAGADTPCAVVAPYAPKELDPALLAALEGPCTFTWAEWDGALDGG